MRLDRAITLGIAGPLLGTLGRLRTLSHQPSTLDPILPILMYHSISDQPETGVQPYYRTTTSPAHFARQMRWLGLDGWRGVTLSEGLTWLATASNPSSTLNSPSRAPSPRPVAITFDDGYRDFQTAAVPALSELGFRATMFLPTAFIGEQPRSFKERQCLTWTGVKELHQAGFEFGSHTVNHPRLVDLPSQQVELELRDSRVEIERRLDSPATTFAYPYAFPEANRTFTARLTDTLARTGYTCCVTTQIGRAQPGDDPFTLKRLPVNSDDDLPLLQAKLNGAYDWLAQFQSAFKKTKGLLVGTR